MFGSTVYIHNKVRKNKIDQKQIAAATSLKPVQINTGEYIT